MHFARYSVPYMRQCALYDIGVDNKQCAMGPLNMISSDLYVKRSNNWRLSVNTHKIYDIKTKHWIKLYEVPSVQRYSHPIQ